MRVETSASTKDLFLEIHIETGALKVGFFRLKKSTKKSGSLNSNERRVKNSLKSEKRRER